MKKFLHVAYWLVFAFYAYLLINTVFFARDARRSVNVVPFDMMIEQGFTLNVWGNILMFIPLGLYAAHFVKQFRFWRVLSIVIGASVAIEVLQYVLARGSSDIDDVLLNTAGGLLGMLLYVALQAMFKSKERVQQVISMLSLLVGLPVFVLALVLTLYN